MACAPVGFVQHATSTSYQLTTTSSAILISFPHFLDSLPSAPYFRNRRLSCRIQASAKSGLRPVTPRRMPELTRAWHVQLAQLRPGYVVTSLRLVVCLNCSLDSPKCVSASLRLLACLDKLQVEILTLMT